jgi:hypothetical protein
MPDLSNKILHYYREHFEDLPFDKQFHFASRLYLWNQDAWADRELTRLRPDFTAKSNPQAALQAVAEATLGSSVHGSKNAAALRLPYFERYPKLKAYVSTLFRMHFMRLVYGLDARPAFHELFPPAEIAGLRHSLLQDRQALAILSTHAINFLYLYDRSFSENNTLPIDTFLEVGRTQYDLNDRMHLQLFIYLYTHCILGESLFYYRRLPADKQEVYLTMLQELEAVIDTHFEDINLDNKCEFLVCAKILGRPSRLEERIFNEAGDSISDDGTYLIDRHNRNPQTDNISLEKSEHRNVLYLLANLDFTPLA